MTGDDALRERVAELEARLDHVSRAQAEHERAATDPQGRKWTVGDLMGMGLTRRQALGAIGAIAGGATFASALSGSVAAQPTGDEGAVGTQANPVEVWASEIDATEVATGKGEITNETFVEAHNDANRTGLSSGTWHDVADTEDEDRLNEQDGSFNINVNNTGKYVVSVNAHIYSATDQDRIEVALRDVDGGSIVENAYSAPQMSGGEDEAGFAKIVELTSGTNYKIQVRNNFSTFNLAGSSSGNSRSWYDVTWSPIQ